MKVQPVFTGKRALFLASLVLIVIISLAGTAQAATYGWQVNYQHVTLDVDQSGNVKMTYQVDAKINSNSDPWNEVWIPVTVGNMQITEITGSDGNPHGYYIDGGQIKTQGWNLNAGSHVNLIIKSTLPGFVYQSDTPGRDIVQFTPPWWDMTIADTMVKYVLPGEINVSDVKTGNRQYSGIGTEADGRTMVFFNRTALNNNEQFDTAVSFPDSFMAPGAVTSKGTPSGGGTSDLSGVVSGIFDNICSLAFCGIWIIVPIMIIIGILGGNRKNYGSPTLSMNGMGVNQNLDPVEAAMLLRDDPRRILTMIMFGLMKKGNVKLISTEPLQLQLVARKDLNYYEALFADAIKGDVLNEDKLLTCFKALAQRVVDKTRPYSRKETEAFYRKKIDDAWNDVKALDTPELKLQKYDTNMFWLMADEQFTSKTPDALRSPGWNTATIPPYYWWYPYYFGFPHGGTGPSTGTPTPSGGTPSTNQTTSSVESFAKNITSSVEKTSAGVVGGVESFLGVRNAANAPPAAPAPSRSSSGGSACVSCACACVSCACACACAGGGGGCT
jgi:hypothetical protein